VSASEIVISTSTPYPGLAALAQRYGARLFVHGQNRGIAHDWNAALAQSTTDWVTIAHQDDLYYPDFIAWTMAAAASAEDALLVFTGYEELVGDRRRRHSTLLTIKRALLELGFLGRGQVSTRRARIRCLRFGCPIPCPSVTLHRARAAVQFNERFQVNLDWAAWLALCETEGSFVWVRSVLMGHRIHASSETSNAIQAGRRAKEDALILGRLWPGWIGRLLARSYRLAYASNNS
jgi:hypothetical protein